jgi:hypothetical protein
MCSNNSFYKTLNSEGDVPTSKLHPKCLRASPWVTLQAGNMTVVLKILGLNMCPHHAMFFFPCLGREASSQGSCAIEVDKVGSNDPDSFYSKWTMAWGEFFKSSIYGEPPPKYGEVFLNLQFGKFLVGSPIFSGYMEPDDSMHNLAGEWALVIFQFCKISRQDFIWYGWNHTLNWMNMYISIQKLNEYA